MFSFSFFCCFFQVQTSTCLLWGISKAPIPLIFISTVGKLLNNIASTIGLAFTSLLINEDMSLLLILHLFAGQAVESLAC
jgi:hypothetical protein